MRLSRPLDLIFGVPYWISDSGDITTKWYADPVDDKNQTWTLKWNTDNTLSDSAVPVVLKNLAPPTTSKARR